MARRAAYEDWNYTSNFGSSVVTWKSNLIARQTDSCVSAKCRAEQTSLISTEGSSGQGQILHRGHKNTEHLGTVMGRKAAAHAILVASALRPIKTSLLLQWGRVRPGLGVPGTGAAAAPCARCCKQILQLPPKQTKSRGGKAINYQRGQGIWW